MSPTLATNYEANGRGGHAKTISDQAVLVPGGGLLSDCKHALCGEFSEWVPPSSIVGSVFATIALVCCWGVPAQVGEIVVDGDAIIMARLHSIRARADEGFKREAVDREGLLSPATGQIVQSYRWVSVRGGGFEDAAAHEHRSASVGDAPFDAPNLPSVADFVQPLVPNDRFPSFEHFAPPVVERECRARATTPEPSVPAGAYSIPQTGHPGRRKRA